MAQNGMTVGVDYSFGYFDGTTGQLVDLGDIQVIDIKPMKHDISSRPYNDDPRFGYVPDGFKIEFSITRIGSVMEDLMITILQNFSQGNTAKPGYLNQTVYNPDGTAKRYQFTKFVVFPTDLGNISREKTVTQKLEGMASKMVTLA